MIQVFNVSRQIMKMGYLEELLIGLVEAILMILVYQCQ
jgi:hypothetical protein